MPGVFAKRGSSRHVVALTLTLLCGLTTRGDAQKKVDHWELCAAPWKESTGWFNTTTDVQGYTPTQASAVVRRLYPCPYDDKSQAMGLWTQYCNLNIYAYNQVEEDTATTTCYNTLVVYGDYAKKAEGGSFIPATMAFDSLATVTYGEPHDHDHNHRRQLAGAHDHDEEHEGEWRPPESIELSNIKLINGAGKLKQVFKYVSTVDVHYSIKEETEEYTEWDAKLTMEYKNKWFNYLYL